MHDLQSALYAGRVMHQRLKPRRHRLSYRMFFLLLDLDEIDRLAARLWLFSHNRFNLFAFAERDHGDGSGRALKDYVERQLDMTQPIFWTTKPSSLTKTGCLNVALSIVTSLQTVGQPILPHHARR